MRTCARHGVHDGGLGHVHLWIQIRRAELTSPAAPGRDFNRAERGPFVGQDNALSTTRVGRRNSPGEGLSRNRLLKQGEGLRRFTPTFQHAVDAQLIERVRLYDLPAAGAADDDLESRPVRAGLERVEQEPRVVRGNGLFRCAENRGEYPGGKGRAERIVGRDANRARARPDVLRQVLGVAGNHVAGAEGFGEDALRHSQTGRHARRRSVGVAFDPTPPRELQVQHELQPTRHRCHGHLQDEVRSIDRLAQRG